MKFNFTLLSLTLFLAIGCGGKSGSKSSSTESSVETITQSESKIETIELAKLPLTSKVLKCDIKSSEEYKKIVIITENDSVTIHDFIGEGYSLNNSVIEKTQIPTLQIHDKLLIDATFFPNKLIAATGQVESDNLRVLAVHFTLKIAKNGKGELLMKDEPRSILNFNRFSALGFKRLGSISGCAEVDLSSY